MLQSKVMPCWVLQVIQLMTHMIGSIPAAMQGVRLDGCMKLMLSLQEIVSASRTIAKYIVFSVLRPTGHAMKQFKLIMKCNLDTAHKYLLSN